MTILYYGFTNENKSFTFDNITSAVTDPVNIKAFFTTMLLALLATVICLSLAYPLAVCLSKLKMRRKNFLIFLFILPMWMNFMLQMVINRTEEGKLVGDVDFASVEPVAGAITPVPGGVGPMTITMLMRNTIECFLNRMNNQ